MRTKVALSAAALVAGALSSLGQVYSANIVGYYNVQTPNALNCVAIQLVNGSSSAPYRADQAFPYSDGDNIQLWNGHSWDIYIMDSGSSTGWYASDGGTELPVTSLPNVGPGKAIMYGNNGAHPSITVVGQCKTDGTTNSIPGGLSALASPQPYSGGIVTGGAHMPIPDGNSDNVQFWNGHSWNLFIYDSGSSTSWYASDGGTEIPEPQLTVGQGFFFGNNGGAFSWGQAGLP